MIIVFKDKKSQQYLETKIEVYKENLRSNSDFVLKAN